VVNEIVKAVLCLLIIAAIFAGTGCAGRADRRESIGSADQATPTPAPAASAAPTPGPASPSPTAQPDGNYTTTLGLDDVLFSGGDEEYGYPEDLLPTPPAE